MDSTFYNCIKLSQLENYRKIVIKYYLLGNLYYAIFITSPDITQAESGQEKNTQCFGTENELDAERVFPRKWLLISNLLLKLSQGAFDLKLVSQSNKSQAGKILPDIWLYLKKISQLP